MGEMSGAWFPEPGDVVTFPDAPSASSRARRYLIVSRSGSEVTYRPEWLKNWCAVMDYTGRLGALWLLGMTRVQAARTQQG